MNRLKKLCILLPGLAVAFVGITCAPVDPPGAEEATVSTPAVAPTSAKEALPPPMVPQSGLRDRVRLAIDQVRKRDLLTTNGFWTVFHGILGLGPSVTL